MLWIFSYSIYFYHLMIKIYVHPITGCSKGHILVLYFLATVLCKYSELKLLYALFTSIQKDAKIPYKTLKNIFPTIDTSENGKYK